MKNKQLTKVSKPKMTKVQKLESLKSKCININFINECITKYQEQTKSVVERTLDMCDTVNSIHKKVKSGELKESDLDYFCQSVVLDKKGSTFRKFICISHYSEKFRQYIDSIPSSYSVLYEITTLDSDKFEMLINNNLLHQFLTLSEVKKLTNKTVTPTQSTEVSLKINFDINNISQDTLILINGIRNSVSSNNEIKLQIQNEDIFEKSVTESVITV